MGRGGGVGGEEVVGVVGEVDGRVRVVECMGVGGVERVEGKAVVEVGVEVGGGRGVGVVHGGETLGRAEDVGEVEGGGKQSSGRRGAGLVHVRRRPREVGERCSSGGGVQSGLICRIFILSTASPRDPPAVGGIHGTCIHSASSSSQPPPDLSEAFAQHSIKGHPAARVVAADKPASAPNTTTPLHSSFQSVPVPPITHSVGPPAPRHPRRPTHIDPNPNLFLFLPHRLSGLPPIPALRQSGLSSRPARLTLCD